MKRTWYICGTTERSLVLEQLPFSLRRLCTNMVLVFPVGTGYKSSKEEKIEQVRVQMSSLAKAAYDINVRCTKDTTREHILILVITLSYLQNKITHTHTPLNNKIPRFCHYMPSVTPKIRKILTIK